MFWSFCRPACVNLCCQTPPPLVPFQLLDLARLPFASSKNMP